MFRITLGQLGPGIEWVGGESWDIHSYLECKLGQLRPGIEWAGGECWDVHSCTWDNKDQGLSGQGENPGISIVVQSVKLGQLGPGIEWEGGDSWDVHSCPELRWSRD